jgi:hypothetical protein
LTSVSCPSASFCVAEGIVNFYAYEPQKSYLVAVGYNHGSWSAPAKLNAGPAAPIAVSCFSVSFCLALGSGAQALTYNGSSWSAPIGLGSTLGEARSVSCTSATFCVAVADAPEGSGALTYSGSSWSAPTTVDRLSALYSVSCASASFCAAVGGGPAEPDNAVIYSGGSWSAPQTIDGSGDQFTSVSCPSPSFCVAVDEKGDALTYNGHSWSAPVHVASAAQPTELEAVSCASPSFCAAVGQTNDERGDGLTYNGRSWSAPTTIDPDSGLHSVSCPSTSFCVAVDGLGNALSYAAAATPTGGYERRPSLRVEPHAVRAGGHVLVSGFIGRVRGQLGCPVGAQVDLLSSAFAPSRHEFAGVPTAYSKVRRNGSFSARAAIPARRHQGVYVVSGRCGGGNLGVSTRLRVR